MEYWNFWFTEFGKSTEIYVCALITLKHVNFLTHVNLLTH